VTRRLTTGAAIVIVAALGLAACGDSGPSASSAGSSSSAPATSTTSSSTTAPRGEATLLTADDAVLVAPGDPHPVEVDPADPCAALARGDACETGGELAWVTAAAPTDRSPVTVYLIDDGAATPALVVDRESRAEYASARVERADLDGEPGDELVVGLRNAGTGGLLQIDVVGPSGEVAAHLTLDQGRATLEDGQLRTWAARYLSDDPNCCPSRFQQAVVGVADGRWMSYAEREVTADEVPEGDFPAG
jgi:hypothetical protein